MSHIYHNIFYDLALPTLFLFAALLTYFFFSRKVLWLPSGKKPARILKLLIFFMAFFLAAFALSDFSVKKKTGAVSYFFIFDVSPSQLAEDYFDQNGKMTRRLDAAKKTVVESLPGLPENAFVAMAAMVGHSSELTVFLPLTSVEDRQAINEGLELIDWWNAWDDGSGLRLFPDSFYSVTKSWKKPLNVVVFGDGGGDDGTILNEYASPDGIGANGSGLYGNTYIEYGPVNPKLNEESLKIFDNRRNRILMVGVGKIAPSEVPKLDAKGKKIGCLKNGSSCFMSGLNENVLKKSAAVLNGEYYPIENKEAIRGWLAKNPLASPQSLDAKISYSRLFGLLSLFFLVIWII